MYPLPNDETTRLKFLAANQLSGRPMNRALDDLTRLASDVFDTPIALVTIVTEHDQFFHGRTGIGGDGTPRAVSFCAHAITSDRPFVVLDATRDPRFADNPLVTGDPQIRFYAGAPIITGDGLRLGAFCVIDIKAKSVFSDKSSRILKKFANLAAKHFRRLCQTNVD